MHVVCEWIGNSKAVAAKHYLQVTHEHFAKAAEIAAHNTMQWVGMGGNGPEADREISEEVTKSRMPLVFGMGDTGLEPVTSAV